MHLSPYTSIVPYHKTCIARHLRYRAVYIDINDTNRVARVEHILLQGHHTTRLLPRRVIVIGHPTRLLARDCGEWEAHGVRCRDWSDNFIAYIYVHIRGAPVIHMCRAAYVLRY